MPESRDASDGNQRLTLAEVEERVATFSNPVILKLAEGPVRDISPMEPEYWLENTPKDCCVCQALEPIREDSAAANSLLDWHSFVGKSFEMLEEMVKVELPGSDTEREVQEELLSLFGTLAYSRCLVIYSAARGEARARGLDLPTLVERKEAADAANPGG